MDGHQIERAEAQDYLAERGAWFGIGNGGLSDDQIDVFDQKSSIPLQVQGKVVFLQREMQTGFGVD